MNRSTWGSSLAVVAAGLWLGVAAPGAVAQAPEYVGTDACIGCHEGYDEALGKTPHGGAAYEALTAEGCESCHGPGSDHVENPDDEAKRPRVTDLSASDQSAMCQDCHDGAGQFFWAGSGHEARGLSCLSCHSVHAYKSEESQLKAVTIMDQCFDCHADVRAETWKNSRHPIREGKITCGDCHDPHGTQTDAMLTAASLNDQCYQCHTEKRGPFLWEHPPVRESCSFCHVPHGSNHLKLQKTSVPYICQQCHSNTRHPGSLYDRTTLADGSRPSNRDFSRACLNCHAAIHGSNHPSAPYLGF